jgi:hypothetical protein
MPLAIHQLTHCVCLLYRQEYKNHRSGRGTQNQQSQFSSSHTDQAARAVQFYFTVGNPGNHVVAGREFFRQFVALLLCYIQKHRVSRPAQDRSYGASSGRAGHNPDPRAIRAQFFGDALGRKIEIRGCAHLFRRWQVDPYLYAP